MCFHAARFDARVALDGGIVLFEQQDRSAWNWSDVREGHGVARQVRRRRRIDALSRGSGHRLGALPGADLRGHRLAAGSPKGTTRSTASRRRRSTRSTAPSPKPTCTARKPGSTAWPPSSRKTSPPAIPAGTRSSASSTSASASTPPPSAPGGRHCAGRARAPIKSSCAAASPTAASLKANPPPSNPLAAGHRFDHNRTGPKMVPRTLEYIHANPLRRGLHPDACPFMGRLIMDRSVEAACRTRLPGKRPGL